MIKSRERRKVDCASPDYAFQTPFTKLELFCFDGYAWEIVCEPAFSQTVRRCLPEAKTPEEFYAAQKRKQRRMIAHETKKAIRARGEIGRHDGFKVPPW